MTNRRMAQSCIPRSHRARFSVLGDNVWLVLNEEKFISCTRGPTRLGGALTRPTMTKSCLGTFEAAGPATACAHVVVALVPHSPGVSSLLQVCRVYAWS